MSATTVTKHTPAELTYHGTSSEGIALFSSASKSRPGTRNWTYLDTRSGLVACECQAKSGTCWHVDLAPTALAMAAVAGFVAGLDDANLVATGVAAGATIKAGTHTATDIAVYWACKVAWLARREAVAARAVVAEWETLSYSDRHIDRHFDGRRGEREYDAARSALHRLQTLAA